MASRSTHRSLQEYLVVNDVVIDDGSIYGDSVADGNNEDHDNDENDVLTNLYPALAQCVFVIFVGYFTGRIKLIPTGGIKGF